jgi:hypothetical protein
MRRDEDAAKTISALSRAFSDKGFSENSCLRSIHALNRLNMTPRHGIQRRGAGETKLPIDHDGASTTILSATAKSHALQPEHISECENQKQTAIRL